MAMELLNQIKCMVLLLPIIGAVILGAYLQDIYSLSSLWILLPIIVLVPIAWKIFTKWAK
ncbi:MAG: hypothetical protein ACTSVK_17850 [Promethearchaeota archaeon]